MKTGTKYLGVWMDHSTARLMELKEDAITTNIVESVFTYEDKQETLNRSENIMHNKEQHQQSEYYKKIGEAIRNYNEVVLFGPTTAKSELLNLLKADHRFENIKIEVKPAEKMTETQEHAFLRAHFQVAKVN